MAIPLPPRDPASARVDYASGELTEDGAGGSPYPLFRRWYDDAAGAVDEPNAMVLSTVAADGAPSSRTVLLKGLTDETFVFFTNYGSRKGVDLAGDPRCGLLFPWYALHRQVRVEGPAERVSREESEAYFATRPRDAQLGAWASDQSRVVDSRQALEDALAEATARFDGVEVPCPPDWGGFAVRPQAIEFWQGRGGRLHDRLLYSWETAAAEAPAETGPEGWRVLRLAP